MEISMEISLQEKEATTDQINLQIRDISGKFSYNESFNKKDVVGFMKYCIRMRFPELVKKNLKNSYAIINKLKFYKENKEGTNLFSIVNDLKTIGETFTENDKIRIGYNINVYTYSEIGEFIHYLFKPYIKTDENNEDDAEEDEYESEEDVEDYEAIIIDRIHEYIEMNSIKITKDVAYLIAFDSGYIHFRYLELNENDRDLIIEMLKAEIVYSYSQYLTDVESLKTDVELALIALKYNEYAFKSIPDNFKHNKNFIFSALKVNPEIKNKLSDEMKEKINQL